MKKTVIIAAVVLVVGTGIYLYFYKRNKNADGTHSIPPCSIISFDTATKTGVMKINGKDVAITKEIYESLKPFYTADGWKFYIAGQRPGHRLTVVAYYGGMEALPNTETFEINLK